MHISSLALTCLALTIGLVGCASVPAPIAPAPKTQVQYHAVTDKHAKHYQLKGMQTAVMPTVGPDNPVPVYPPDLVPFHLPPQTIQAKLIVDRTGDVTDVRFSGPSNALHAKLQQAVRTATLQWSFLPLSIQTWQEQPDGSQKVVKSKPVPFSQDYVFVFALVDGKPVVTNRAP